MPTNLHALIRFRTLDKCFRDPGRHWSWQELAGACSVTIFEETGKRVQISRRTVLQDIYHLRNGTLGHFAPVIYDREQKGYRYENPKYSIQYPPLKPSDFETLRSAVYLGKQLLGDHQLTDLVNVLIKLEDQLNLGQDATENKIIRFESILPGEGHHWIDILYQAIRNRQTLLIRYQPFERETLQWVISPYCLKEYNNRWFVLSHNHNTGMISTIALDRIMEAKPSLQHYKTDPEFDPDHFLRDIIGVSIPLNLEKQVIRLKVFKTQKWYMKTKPWHISQLTEAWAEDFAIFRYELIPNYELEEHILSKGESIEVLEPDWLRDKIRKKLNDAIGNYNGS